MSTKKTDNNDPNNKPGEGDGQGSGEGGQGKTYTQAEVDQLVQGLKGKVDELLDEKKASDRKARELEQQQEEAERNRLHEKEEFRELYEREQKDRQTLQERYDEFKREVEQQKIKNEALSVASGLTKDTDRASLLSEKAMEFARVDEDGNVRFELGGVQVEIDKIKEHLGGKYPFLVDGSGSSGGGASGSHGGGAAKAWTDMSEQEHVELYKRDPDQYRRMRDAAKQQ